VAQGLEISLLGFAVAALFYPIAYHMFVYYLLGLAVAVKLIARRERAAAARPAPGPARARPPRGAPVGVEALS
jgi:hypothetical protein